MRTPIKWKFGTLKGLITANHIYHVWWESDKESWNYLHKIRSNFCHTHRVNPLKDWAENCYVVGVTIIEVPLCGLKVIKVETMEIIMTKNPPCVTIMQSNFMN